jgi:hypothetical protein
MSASGIGRKKWEPEHPSDDTSFIHTWTTVGIRMYNFGTMCTGKLIGCQNVGIFSSPSFPCQSFLVEHTKGLCGIIVSRSYIGISIEFDNVHIGICLWRLKNVRARQQFQRRPRDLVLRKMWRLKNPENFSWLESGIWIWLWYVVRQRDALLASSHKKNERSCRGVSIDQELQRWQLYWLWCYLSWSWRGKRSPCQDPLL